MPSLDQFFDSSRIHRHAEFERLGGVGSVHNGTLAYSDVIKYVRLAMHNPSVTCLITTPALAEAAEGIPGIVLSDSPRDDFFRLHSRWLAEKRYVFPFPSHRGEGCRIHSSAIVAENCWLGDNVVIGENVVIREGVRLGNDVLVEPGVCLSVEGILYHRTEDGPRIIGHGGYVDIEDNVALLCGSKVVRSVHDTDPTVVGRASIVGINSVIGHEAKVGAHVVVSNQCVLARGSHTGKGAFLGTGAFVREYVTIGANAQVMAGSVVINDVPAGGVVSGNFATDHKRRMMELAKELRLAHSSPSPNPSA